MLVSNLVDSVLFGGAGDVPGLQIRVNLSASEISKLADRVISKSREVHDSVASMPLHKVTFTPFEVTFFLMPL